MIKKYHTQKPKFIFLEAGKKKVLGTSKIMDLVIPAMFDETIAFFKKIHKLGGCHENSWTQQILPLQITFLGKTVLISLPGETSTKSGERIEKQMLETLKGKSIERVILTPYSNSYCGYITTPEEYEAQCYEGGHTVFGKWTLPCIQTELKKIALEMLKTPEKRDLDKNLKPPRFSLRELRKRMYSQKNNG